MDAPIVNPFVVETEKAKEKCVQEWENYETCGKRIQGKSGHDCEAWYFDYFKCLDKWRAPNVMKHLK